jgi:uncharacterized protein with NRDE domain
VQRYNGFNLLVGDLSSSSAVQVSNRVDSSIQQLGPGLHGISNGKLGAASWPKVALTHRHVGLPVHQLHLSLYKPS